MSGGMTRSLGARLRSRDLGTFTWAGLQSAYPNGGGALAALPAGVTAWASDLGVNGAPVTPNAAKTRWNTSHPVVLVQAALATLTGTTAWTDQHTLTVPAGLLTDHALFVEMLLTMTGTAGTKDMRCFYGAAQVFDKGIGSTMTVMRLERTLYGLGVSNQITDRANMLGAAYELSSGSFGTAAQNSDTALTLVPQLKLTNAADSITMSLYKVTLL
jgi:hypothetical protein